MNEHVRKKIQAAFEAARSLGTTGEVRRLQGPAGGPTASPDLKKVTMDIGGISVEKHYTEGQRHEFHHHANRLIRKALASPAIQIQHETRLVERAYFVGDIDSQPCINDVLSEIEKL